MKMLKQSYFTFVKVYNCYYHVIIHLISLIYRAYLGVDAVTHLTVWQGLEFSRRSRPKCLPLALPLVALHRQ